ncbi:MAG: glycoside hydrolase family 2 protein [Lachnospiraceae bacterium]|nr:glycoside hydrolase family 2 protein [Lachnospiraceae bacterium]
MVKRLLNEGWYLHYQGEMFPAKVPCSVVSTLLAHQKIEDPYVRDHEQKIQPIFEEDYTFTTTFQIEDEERKNERLLLVFDCLDTVCDIFLNETLLASEKNMFRRYRYDVKEYVQAGKNRLRVLFHSPVKYLRDHKADLGKPFNVIRKAGCMFGWDWGITLPDSGILGDVYLMLDDGSEIEDLFVKQTHRKGEVRLKTTAEMHCKEGDQVRFTLYDPEGNILEERMCAGSEAVSQTFTIASPRLWMPVGYGEQPLYTVKVSLCRQTEVISQRSRRIGLRTVRIDTARDGKGHKFQIVVNETPVYFRGENMIINDAIIPQVTEATWDALVENALASNLNGIRVWGGAYYPDDHFYELCDAAGLMVYQDFMFACTFYYPSDAFIENVAAEVEYQLKRIRNHPSLVLLCGNNELDCLYTTMTSKEERTVALRKLFKADKAFDLKTALFIRHIYSKIFLRLIPSKVRALCPEIPFIHSTPHASKPLAAKSFVDYTWDGDMHYYLQYDGNAPYQIMQTKEMLCRFISEIGFQSYPSMKTLREYMAEEDLEPYSDVMYAHQKCFEGNETIELYMEREYLVPEAFEDYVYLSQVQAGEIMRYSAEYQRRHNDYNKGMILWQLNDCWPVVSWSGIDYRGRWKAEQYMIRKFFAAVLVSSEVSENEVSLHVTSDLLSEVSGEVQAVLYERGKQVAVHAIPYQIQTGSKEVFRIPCPEDVASSYLAYQSGGVWNVQLFGAAKDYEFEKPSLKTTIEESEDSYRITVCTDVMCKDVILDLSQHDAIFEDNCFDLVPQEPYTVVLKKSKTDVTELEQVERELTVKTLNDVMLGKSRKGKSAK